MLVLLLFGVLSLSTTMMVYSTANNDILKSPVQILILVSLVSLTYLNTPVFVYLGEIFNRFQVMKAGVVLTMVVYLCYTILLLVQDAIGKEKMPSFTGIIFIILIIPAVIGFGLYAANLPQFGVNQLQFASTEHLVAYTRWFSFVFLLAQASLDIILSFMTTYGSTDILLTAHFVFFATLLLISITVNSLKRVLVVDSPVNKMNGLKLIRQVTPYVWKTKQSQRHPSAFTYSEAPPSRLDYAKLRYGGTFTTIQVEDVKTFWHMVLIPISHVFCTGYFSCVVLGYKYEQCLLKHKSKLDITESILLSNSTMIGEAVAVIGIPILQLIFAAFYPKYIPKILQRMWLGMLFLVLSSISVAVLSFNVTTTVRQELTNTTSKTINCDQIWSHYAFVVPEFLTGLGLLLNLTARLEFIVAQAPHNMQSIFIGALYSQYFFPYLINIIGVVTPAGLYWEFYVALSCLQVISFVAFTIIKWKYKYRQCNNSSDVNYRMIIENVFEKDLDKAWKATQYESTKILINQSS